MTSLLLSWLSLILGCHFAYCHNYNLMDSIAFSFKERGQIYCISVITDVQKDAKAQFTSTVPMFLARIEDMELIKMSSKMCKNHILYLDTLEALQTFNFQSLTLGKSKFAIVMEYWIGVEQVKKLLVEKPGEGLATLNLVQHEIVFNRVRCN